MNRVKMAGLGVMAFMVVLTAPASAVESMYLDSVPVTYPGEYLAPATLYLQVPPPTGKFLSADSLAPATIYDTNVLRPADTVSLTSTATRGSGYLPDMESDDDRDHGKIRVLLKQGLDHASDIPLAVIRDHLAELENIELVNEGEPYDMLVEVETMKPGSAGIVFLVINAYKNVEDEQLIFYNTFGYLGELKLLSGSSSYASQLQTALEQEAGLAEE